METVLVHRVFLRRFSDASSPLPSTKVSHWYAGVTHRIPMCHMPTPTAGGPSLLLKSAQAFLVYLEALKKEYKVIVE